MSATPLGRYMATVKIIEASPPKKKTDVYEVLSLSSGARLGLVRWYSQWRQYVFEPGDATLFNRACMIDLSNFLRRVNDEHKAKGK